MKTIIVTGSVATGKTTLAKTLSKKLNYNYVDLQGLIKKHKLFDSYDKKRKSKVVDIKKLNNFLIKQINESKKPGKYNGIIIDSHLSHYLPDKYVDLCIVTKCSLKVLEKRLKNRNYSKEKIRENLDAEIFDICLEEARKNKHKIRVIDATRKTPINNILKWIK